MYNLHQKTLLKIVLSFCSIVLLLGIQLGQASYTVAMSPVSQERALAYVLEKGYMQGDPDGNFHPERPIIYGSISY